MSKLLTALLTGAALTLSGTAALAAEQGDSQRRDSQTQAQPDSSKGQSGQSNAQNSNQPNQSGASNTNRNDPTQQNQNSADKRQSGNANQSAYEAEQDVIAKMKCDNLSGQKQKDCMANVKAKAQLDSQHDQSSQAGAGGQTSQSTGARAGADASADANTSPSTGANAGSDASQAGGPASKEQEAIARMKCNSMSGKQKDDCMGAAKKQAGQM